jgi:hypothetical protein
MADQTQDLNESVNLQARLNELLLQEVTTMNQAKTALTVSNNIQKDLIAKAKKRGGIEGEIMQITAEVEHKLRQIAIRKQLISAKIGDQIRLESKINQLTEEINEKIREQSDLQEKIGGSEHQHISDILNQIPLVGKLLSFTKQMVSYWKTHPLLAAAHLSLIGILYTTSQIVAKFLELDKASSAFRKQMGIFLDDNVELEKTAVDIAIAYQGVGVNAENAYNSFKSIGESVGSTSFATKEMVTQMSLFSAQLGISEKVSADFMKSMGMVAGSTLESQKHMIGFTQRLASAGGVKLDDVMNDVASASKSSYQFLSKNPLALAKAAVESRRMGTSLEQSTSSAKELIEFTSSVKSEMEASVLLGKSLNLQKARELSYNRNIEGLNKEILRLAKEANFEQLDAIQQEAVAKAFGMQAGAVSAMLLADKERRKIMAASTGPLKDQVLAYESMRKANSERAKDEANSLENTIKIRSNQESIKALSDAWKSIFQSLVQDILPPVVKLMRGIADTLNTMSPAWKKVTAGALVFAGVLTGVVLIALTKVVGVMSSKILGGVGKGAHGLFSGIGRGLASIGGVFGNAMKGVAVIAALGASLVIFAAAFKLVENVKQDTFQNMLASVALLGLMAGIFSFAAPALLVGAGVIAILGAALIPFGVAALAAGGGMLMLGKGFESVVGGFERLTKLSFLSTTAQILSLTSAITAMSIAIADIPTVEVSVLEKLGQLNLFQKPREKETLSLANDTTNTALLKEISGLRSDLIAGKIAVHVYLDPQKSATVSGRYLELSGNEKPGK